MNWVSAVMLAVGVLVAPFSTPAAAAPAADARPSAPAFTLDSLEGKRVRLDDFKGKVVVVTFWATWCAPCKQELKHLNEMYKRSKGAGLVVLAVSTDGPETRSDIRGAARRGRWKMPVLVDKDGAVTGTLNPRGTIPFSLFVDRNGRVAHHHAGYTAGDERSYRKVIDRLLAEPAR